MDRSQIRGAMAGRRQDGREPSGEIMKGTS
jgi:hypothetical protein